jgi:hypothetical protein
MQSSLHISFFPARKLKFLLFLAIALFLASCTGEPEPSQADKQKGDENHHKGFYPNGKLWWEMDYVKGQAHGMYRIYTMEGKVAYMVRFINGKKEGYGREFDEDGKVRQRGYYEHDIRMGNDVRYYANGLVEEYRFRGLHNCTNCYYAKYDTAGNKLVESGEPVADFNFNFKDSATVRKGSTAKIDIMIPEVPYTHYKLQEMMVNPDFGSRSIQLKADSNRISLHYPLESRGVYSWSFVYSIVDNATRTGKRSVSTFKVKVK